MRYIQYLFATCILLSANNALAIRAYFDYKVFNAPDSGPYVEFITSFDGESLDLAAAENGLFQSKAELVLILTQTDKIIDFRKLIVDGPLVGQGEYADFMSLERFTIPNGNYDLEIQIKDLNKSESNADVVFQKVFINNPVQSIFISDIQFVSAYSPTEDQNAFSKSGYDLLPYISNFFPSDLNSIIFYVELYNTDLTFGKDEGFISAFCIVDQNERVLELCQKIKREKAAQVIPLLQMVNITDLPTGEYKLKIEIRDRNNQVVFTKYRDFTRNKVTQLPLGDVSATPNEVQSSFAGSFTDRDSLYALIQAHLPIASAVEISTIDLTLKEADLQTLQSFLYSFWLKRNPEDPTAAFRKYEKMVYDVEKFFATRNVRGWRTDRGRVYLQYGPPNTRIIRNNDPTYWPFEIWHYYVTNNNLHNRKFLFCNTALDDDYALIHSDVPSEVKNHNWSTFVRSRAGTFATQASSNNANQRKDPYSGDILEDLWANPH